MCQVMKDWIIHGRALTSRITHSMKKRCLIQVHTKCQIIRNTLKKLKQEDVISGTEKPKKMDSFRRQTLFPHCPHSQFNFQ